MLTTEITTQTRNLHQETAFSVFPNPASTDLYLKGAESLRGKKYVLRSFFGRTILSGRILTVNQQAFDISGLRRGVYFLTVGNQTVRVVKR